MKMCGNWPVGVCSWSVNNDPKLLNELRARTGIDRVHLGLNPAILGQGGYLDQLAKDGWSVSATMVGFAHEDYSTLESIKETGGIMPDRYWPENRDTACKAIELTAKLNVRFMEFHFGFIDEKDPACFNTLIVRVKELADFASRHNVVLLMETGQETAATLRHFLETLGHESVAVNFDPANMILYGKGDPVEAVGVLHGWIRHVHIKDALAPKLSGQWGQEVPWGTGNVRGEKFLHALHANGYAGTLSIEREAGAHRLEEIADAAARLNGFGV